MSGNVFEYQTKTTGEISLLIKKKLINPHKKSIFVIPEYTRSTFYMSGLRLENKIKNVFLSPLVCVSKFRKADGRFLYNYLKHGSF